MLEAAVIAVADVNTGESINAFVVARVVARADLELGELKNDCQPEFAGYKVPRENELRSQLPKSIVGKVLRRQLREPGSLQN